MVDIRSVLAGIQGASQEREETDFMGHSFGHIGSSDGRIGARQTGSSTSIRHFPVLALGLAVALMIPVSNAAAQETSPAPAPTPEPSEVQFVQAPNQGLAPITITLKDAMDRAGKLDPTLTGAIYDAKSAHEDRLQARNAMLPQITATSAYLGTQGDGGAISDGRFVTNDGIHVYRAWGVLKQDLSPALLMGTGYQRAKAAEALANAKSEIARRGLTVTVTKNYYGLVVAQRKYATAQAGLDQAKKFMDMTRDSEHQGQAAHSDAIKAELQYRIQKQAFDESRFAMEDARLTLAVMLFPSFSENFTVVDDLDSAPALPPFPDIQALAEKQNPDMRAAMETLRQSDLDIKSAKSAFLPTITVETDYGIEANCFALRCARASFPEVGVVPNLGYFLTATLELPVWDWGTLRSKLHQAQYKQQTAKSQLTLAQRTAVGELYALYDEALLARAALDDARTTAELATEGLRLTNLRYQGGASPATEVVDSQASLVTARNAYADAQVRYRTVLANLQTFTGSF
jgi:outer membrane protein TolC